MSALAAVTFASCFHGRAARILLSIGTRKGDCNNEPDQLNYPSGPEGPADRSITHFLDVPVKPYMRRTVDQRRGQRRAYCPRQTGDGLRNAQHHALLAGARSLVEQSGLKERGRRRA